ncbi:MAG: NAD(P)-binding domain-containing protein [Candidatus Peregrinibacteria bacterium]|nr:NAD(P)-binding domain-containing protein [Candidatus Peregrinibacteria bacterium]
MKKICIVGMGNMGKAMMDILSERGGFELSGCEKSDDMNKKLEQAEVVIIAVKPQVFGELAKSITVDMRGKVVISIMAGIGIEKIKAALKTDKVIRTLPNLALKVGQSLTIWKTTEEIADDEKALAKEILMSFGKEMEVDDESKISSIGVVSGCGPGFIAYFGEQMAGFLMKQGLSEEEAEKVTRQTLIGTGEVVKRNNWNLTDMRKKVSSKGGLTEAGVNAMEAEGLGKVFEKGGDAALKRNEELNK